MKKNKLINKLILALTLAVVVFACSDDDSGGNPDFAGIASTTTEGAGTITIPLRGGSVSADDVIFGGTAIENTDYTLAGVTDEGVQITITNDGLLEENETIRVQIPGEGNVIHTVTILCDGGDSGGFAVADFAGAWVATEDYHDGAPYSAAGYAPVFVQDAGNVNRFNFNDFWDSGATYTAYVVFDLAAGSVSFPNQTVGTNLGTISGSSGTFDLCTNTLTIDLIYHHNANNTDYEFTYIFQK